MIPSFLYAFPFSLVYQKKSKSCFPTVSDAQPFVFFYVRGILPALKGVCAIRMWSFAEASASDCRGVALGLPEIEREGR